MADAGVGRDRLPWLEPYRAPPRQRSNRRAGFAAAIGAAGLAGVLTLLMRDAPLITTADDPVPQASVVVLPEPAAMQPQIVLPPLEGHEQAAARPVAQPVATPRRARVAARRKIKAVPTSAAYRIVMSDQAVEPAANVVPSELAMAIAALPPPAPEPVVRPAVNPRAQVVRGKTVQLGVYTTSRQAELAWQSAVRDYTYLVTMPKSIEAISIRSRRFYRLQLGTPSKTHARQLCTNLRTLGRACTVA